MVGLVSVLHLAPARALTTISATSSTPSLTAVIDPVVGCACRSRGVTAVITVCRAGFGRGAAELVDIVDIVSVSDVAVATTTPCARRGVGAERGIDPAPLDAWL